MTIYVTPCECSQPGWCQRHQCWKSRQMHYFCRVNIDYFAMWEAGETAAQQANPRHRPYPRQPCVHRGATPLEHVECDLCGGRKKKLPVYSCEIFQECTEQRYGIRTERARSMPFCLGCDRYVPNSETGSS